MNQVGFFVGAARRSNAAHRIFAVFGLNALDALRCIAQGFIPAHFFPRIADAVSDHGRGDAVLVRGVTPSKAPFHTRMAFVGFAVFPRHHANHGVAFHFCFEATSYTAVSAGGDDAVLGLTQLDDRFFLQRGGGTSLHTSATGHAIALHERLVLPWRDTAFKAPTRDGQGKSALGFFARAHATVAHDALAGVVGEIGIGLVFLQVAMVRACLSADTVAHVAQAHHTGLGLQFAVTVGAASQAIQGVIADVQLHHPLAQLLQFGRLGVHHHACFCGRGARSWRAFATIDFNQTQAARAKWLQAVGGAQLGHLNACVNGRTHQGRAFGDGDWVAVDGQFNDFFGLTCGGAVVDVVFGKIKHG